MAVICTPARRIGFAFALSVFLHATFFWLPYLYWPKPKLLLPPLTVRLELLPSHEFKPEASAQGDVQPELVTETQNPDEKSTVKSATNTAASMKKMEKSVVTQQFPAHLQLFFTVYQGPGLLRIGEMHHQFEMQKDKYTLSAVKKLAGISDSADGGRFIQISHGKVDKKGLHPEYYEEQKFSSGRRLSETITFDWDAKTLHYQQRGDLHLPDDAQDALSFMYQLSQISMRREVIPLSVSNIVNLEEIEIEVGGTEEVNSKMGKVSALHLRKRHAQGEHYFELWLGQEYRLLPIKFRQIDGKGVVVEELVISDIRASD